ncbi:MAG: nucleotidyltransferase domain-containing protein [Gemmatimonadota bacterium]
MDFIRSRARLAILARTHLAPDQEFYLRELVRATGMAPRTIQVELDKLVASGILAERRHGNRRYLHASRGHPLFSPVREIVLKTAGMVPMLREALEGADVSLAFVFGSVAAGTAGAESDIDLVVVGKTGLRSLSPRLTRAQTELGREINPIVWTPDELRERIAGADPFLARILANPKLMILGEAHDLEGLGRKRLDSAPPSVPKRNRNAATGRQRRP